MPEPYLTEDAFLGGQLTILQPRTGYRAGTDPVFLAASVEATAGQSVLELGCGVGTASLCLGRRVGGLDLTGVELQEEYARLARRNGEANGIDWTVEQADISVLPEEIRSKSYDHVIMNPPYFETKRLTPPRDSGKEIAHIAQGGDVSHWIETGLKRLAPTGQMALINLPEVLPQMLSSLVKKCGSIEISPIVSRVNRQAHRVIVTARKGSRTPLVLHSPRVVHEGETHLCDGDDYSNWASGVLRKGQPFR